MSTVAADFITPKYDSHTYLSSAKVPAPVDDDDVSTKKYVDDNITGSTTVDLTASWSGAITLGSAVYGKMTKNPSGIVTFVWDDFGAVAGATMLTITSDAGCVPSPYRPLYYALTGFCWIYDEAGTPHDKLGVFSISTAGTITIWKYDATNFTSGSQATVHSGGFSYPV